MSASARPAWTRRRGGGAAARDLLEEFAIALSTGAGSTVRGLLHPEVAMLVDSGGLVPDADAAVNGPDAVAEALRALVPPGTSITLASINGVPGLVLDRGGAVVAVVTAETRRGLLTSVWAVSSPEKLGHWNRR